MQGIQVSESSECTDGEELCCDTADTSPTVDSSTPPITKVTRSPDGLSDSMTAVADDLCPSNQLRTHSSTTSCGGEGATDCLQLADYTKHEAKQAMTVTVNNNNNNNELAVPVASEDIFAAGLPSFTSGLSSHEDKRLGCYGVMRVSPIDLSAITEEGDDVTNTSMHLSSCSHEDTPSTPSDNTSTPLDKSASTYSRRSGCSLPEYHNMDSDISESISTHPVEIRGDKSYLMISHSKHHRSYSNPELCSESHSHSQSGYGEEMCSSPPTTTNSQSSSSQATSQSDNHRRKSISEEGLNKLTTKASFTLGSYSPPSTPTSPMSPATGSTGSSSTQFVMPHVESESKLSNKSPAQKKTLSARMRRSKSYTTAALSHPAAGTPNHARFLQQQMNQLTFDQVIYANLSGNLF